MDDQLKDLLDTHVMDNAKAGIDNHLELLAMIRDAALAHGFNREEAISLVEMWWMETVDRLGTAMQSRQP